MSIQHNKRLEKYRDELGKLTAQAISEIEKLKKPVIQFSGPISTGGFGSVSENSEALASCIKESRRAGISVFDQLSYERHMDSILRDHTGYDYPLLDFFYKPILSSKKVHGLIFLPLWKTSIGSTWEYEYATSLGIYTYFLENMTLAEIKRIYKDLEKKVR